MREAFKKLMGVVHTADKINGRKKLQKMVYLLQKAGLDFNKTFRYHYYGPYSTELQLEIDALVDMSLLTESRNGYTYGYSIAGENDAHAGGYGFSKRISSLIDYLNGVPAQVLELASTLAYLGERGYGDFDAIQKKALALKPDLASKASSAKEVYDRILSEN